MTIENSRIFNAYTDASICPNGQSTGSVIIRNNRQQAIDTVHLVSFGQVYHRDNNIVELDTAIAALHLAVENSLRALISDNLNAVNLIRFFQGRSQCSPERKETFRSLAQGERRTLLLDGLRRQGTVRIEHKRRNYFMLQVADHFTKSARGVRTPGIITETVPGHIPPQDRQAYLETILQ